MTKNGTRAAIVATTACVLTVVAILSTTSARNVIGGGRDYAVLSLPESYEDREAVSVLSSGGIDGIVSESTQWVYVDSFDGLERVSLDRYHDRIESFDPRDDGYADKLRSLFISNGRRCLFVPDASPSRLRVVTALFQEGDFSLSVPQRSSAAASSDLVLVVIAALLSLFWGGAPTVIAAAAPALASLACFGAPGLGVAALLAASVRSIVEPARESLRVGRRAVKLRDHPWLIDGLPPALIFGVGALVACAFVGIPFVAALSAIAAGLTAAFAAIAVREFCRGEKGHARFAPVNLAPRFAGAVAASRAALPFAAVALLSFALAGFGIGNDGTTTSPALDLDSVTIDEYRSHMDFQRSFSISRLGATSAKPYVRYHMGSDGLVGEGSNRGISPDAGKPELPPAERMLSRAAPAAEAKGMEPFSALRTLLILAAAMAASAPAVAHALRARVRARNVESIADKRIAA